MSSGFNTDVKSGDRVLHVQTEDRGPNHPSIDTVVYQNGRIFHRKASNYEQFAASPEFSSEELHKRVAEQHKAVIESIRAGELDAEIATAAAEANAAAAAAVKAAGIQVQLLNPGSWLSAGHVALDVEVSRRADKQPLSGAQVEALIEGSLTGERHAGVCDDQGRVKIKFPLPQLGKDDLALVIHAKADAAKDEIRFAMRTRAKNNTPPANPQ
jgi:hypothetical protein